MFVTEAEFLDIANKLKPHFERRMKIEPFPWLRDYYVDMNKLYTELTLEKIENDLLMERRITLQGYRDMFFSSGRNKILIKADPGMGKTTLGKKIGWDWARGLFNKFSMVFFIFLKFVQPDETIENVILRQHAELEGLGVSVEKLGGLLDRFSDKCLLILDGLDEHGLGQNKDILRIIRNQKLFNCGIIVSSRPHNTREIEIYFPTVVHVVGFNKKEAKRFLVNFIDKTKIHQVMRFRPSDSREEFPIQQCPILLSFFCFLVVEKEIDLSDRAISMGDIYFRLLKCLYKKFTIRKNIEFEEQNFFCILKSIGKLSLLTLTSNNPLLQRKEVLKVVGDFAFEYGFFAGHEDFRLCSDPGADIYLTYLHRSVEEFFGSFGFIQALDVGNSVDDILGSDCEEPIFMVNPLILSFCLWFLSAPHLGFLRRDECYDKLTSYVVKRIDFTHTVFDIDEISGRYPAINMMEYLDDSKAQFFRDVLNKCTNITSVHVVKSEIENIDIVLGLMNRHLFDSLTEIFIGDDSFNLHNTDSASLILSIDIPHNIALQIMNLLLQKYNLSERNPQIYLKVAFSADECDITPLFSKYSKELHIGKQRSSFNNLLLKATGEFPDCPILTDITIEKCHVDDSVSAALSKAVNSMKLPSLRRVTLKRCCGKSSRSDWPDKVEVSVKGDDWLLKSSCDFCSKKTKQNRRRRGKLK